MTHCESGFQLHQIEELKMTVQRECEERNELQATLLRAREQLVHITDSALDLHERGQKNGTWKSHSVRASQVAHPRHHSTSLPPLSGEKKSHLVDPSDGSGSHASSSQRSRPNTVTKSVMVVFVNKRFIQLFENIHK
ncbi:hypothetical protein FBUS_07936 [Fasciolopsis buskii]|uniref:Uncharacterized protein n=1 Tax=Fasciolopsis buskii TaxID=27845 RepID=A0A8E0RMT1_9TREM|nr:hypothetical protein FBUS_07936 [Fasciolopsis buski]